MAGDFYSDIWQWLTARWATIAALSLGDWGSILGIISFGYLVYKLVYDPWSVKKLFKAAQPDHFVRIGPNGKPQVYQRVYASITFRWRVEAYPAPIRFMLRLLSPGMRRQVCRVLKWQATRRRARA